ncbi:DNA integrity scanning protein DisA [Candidatus Pacearchaeota archaeon]|nr:MAG: DNA integrity scanning protein DisA [Candidatus Pacearchaeota archaeon]
MARRETQKTILPSHESSGKSLEEEFIDVLKLVSPGTSLRSALNGIIKGKLGALIVIDSPHLQTIIDGGFRINVRFTPQKLIELAKMDGAIILSRDLKKIAIANALLTPSSKIPTKETGTRHKAAERTARQALTLAIAISERRGEVTIYYKTLRYMLADSEELLRKANERMQILEKQRELFDKAIKELDYLELRNYPSLTKAIEALQRGKIVQKMASELKRYVVELGKEGVLIRTRLKEIMSGVEKEVDLIVKDYGNSDLSEVKGVLDLLDYEELLATENLLSALNYEKLVVTKQIPGWRILSRTCLTKEQIAKLIEKAGTLGRAIHSSRDFHEQVLGKEVAESFREEIENIKINSGWWV